MMGIHTRFPEKPDWDWLLAEFSGSGLLTAKAPLDLVAVFARGRQAYLATPYSLEVVSDDLRWDAGLSADMELRTSRWVSALVTEGVLPVSPILLACAACHADFEDRLDPLDDALWSKCCQPLLQASGSVIVPPIKGWNRSRGVWREVCWALRHNMPVWLIWDEGQGVRHG